MIWKKIKEINFNFYKQGFESHVQLPTLHKNEIYFSSRDKNGKSHINKLSNNNEFQTILSPKENFDKDGCMPSCFLENNLFYSSWVVSRNKYVNFICHYDGNKRKKLEIFEGILVNSPFIIYEKPIYRMWYVCGEKWINNKPLYNINYAESKNLLEWTTIKKNCIPKKNIYESPSRPCVIFDGKKYLMYISSANLEKKEYLYKLKSFESNDGINWNPVKINIEYDDQTMLCYPFFDMEKKCLLLNGNQYGKNSILLYKQFS